MGRVHVGGDNYGMQLKHVRQFVEATVKFDGELNISGGACVRTTSPEQTTIFYLEVETK